MDPMTPPSPDPTRKPGGVLSFFVSNPGYGLAAAAPLVAIAIVLAHLFAHLKGGIGWFIEYLAVTATVIGVTKSARLVQSHRTGLLKVGGTLVRREDDPGQFKLWTSIVTGQTAVYIVAAIVLVYIAVKAA
jgi:hypothetical protein